MSFRPFGTNAFNKSFDDETIEAVWEKGTIVPGVNPAVRRKDACGAWIDRDQYGVAVPDGTGWEIDHIIPLARNGKDALGNLQPLQWENNRAKGDSAVGQWHCAKVARI